MSFSDNFIRIMDAIGDRLGIAIDWTSQNMMPYIEQLSQRIINYEISMSIFYMVVFALVLFVGIKVLSIGKRMFNENEDEFGIFPILIGLGIIVFALVGMGTYIKELITAFTLPEKVLLEFIMQYK